jgi:hypothetical protein
MKISETKGTKSSQKIEDFEDADLALFQLNRTQIVVFGVFVS